MALGRVSKRPDLLREGTSYQFPAGIAFHCLCLAVASEMVRAAALVAGGYSIATVPATIPSTIAPSRSHAAATGAGSARIGAVTLRGRDPQILEFAFQRNPRDRSTHSKVAGLIAIVTAAAGRTTVQSQGWAIRLDVAQPVTVVALLG